MEAIPAPLFIGALWLLSGVLARRTAERFNQESHPVLLGPLALHRALMELPVTASPTAPALAMGSAYEIEDVIDAEVIEDAETPAASQAESGADDFEFDFQIKRADEESTPVEDEEITAIDHSATTPGLLSAAHDQAITDLAVNQIPQDFPGEVEEFARLVASRPAPPVEAAAVLAAAGPPVVSLDHTKELEAFDALPSRPRMGNVTTVCPTCRERTKHNRAAECRSCGQVNAHLGRRWEIVSMTAGTAATSMPLAPVAPFEPEPQTADEETPEIIQVAPAAETPALPAARCGGCGRRAVADAKGDCAFCGSSLSGGQHS